MKVNSTQVWFTNHNLRVEQSNLCIAEVMYYELGEKDKKDGGDGVIDVGFPRRPFLQGQRQLVGYVFGVGQIRAANRLPKNRETI